MKIETMQDATAERAKALAAVAWEHPSSYAGYSPDGHYCIATKTRDSTNLELSNWDTLRERLTHAGATIGADGNGVCYDWRAGHCMCGWVEYLMITPDAPQTLLDVAADALLSLADYPALAEDDWSMREYTDIAAHWQDASMQYRVQLCQDSNVCVFAARRDDIPEEVENALRDSGSFA